MHLPVAIATFFRQFVPRLRFTQQFADGALTQPKNVLGEQSLTDVVYREQFSDPPRYVERVQILGGVFVHVVSQHLLEPGLHRVALRYKGLAESTGHTGCTVFVTESERMRSIVETKRTLEGVQHAQTTDVVVGQMVAVVIIVTGLLVRGTLWRWYSRYGGYHATTVDGGG